MKRQILILAGFIAAVILAVVLCAPLIESRDTAPQYHNSGYANTKGIMQGLCVGDVQQCQGVIFKAHANPELEQKLEAYCQVIDGRLYTHIAAVDFLVEGDYPEAPYRETSYMEILMEDGSMLYAVVVFLQETDGCGVTDFDLYTQCPW